MPALVLPVVLDRQITAVLVHPGMDVTRPRPERITDLVKPVDLQAHRPRPAIGRVVEPPINTSRSAEEGDPSETGDSAPMCPNPLDDAHREVRHHQYESENCRQTPWKQRHTLPRPEYHPPDIELSPDQQRLPQKEGQSPARRPTTIAPPGLRTATAITQTSNHHRHRPQHQAHTRHRDQHQQPSEPGARTRRPTFHVAGRRRPTRQIQTRPRLKRQPTTRRPTSPHRHTTTHTRTLLLTCRTV